MVFAREELEIIMDILSLSLLLVLVTIFDLTVNSEY